MFLTISLPLSLSPSLSQTTSRQKFAVKSYGCSRDVCQTPSTPHTPLQVSSSSRNFIRAGFLYKLIILERTSHLLSVFGRGGAGCWVWWTFSFEVHQFCFACSLPPTSPLIFPFFSFLFLSLPFFFIFLFFLLMLISKSDNKCTVKLCQ